MTRTGAVVAARAGNAVFVSDYLYSDAARYDSFTENYRRSLAAIDRALAEACDTVVEAMDMLPNKALAEALDGMEVYCVGDCEKPWNIAEAVTAGNLTARRI